MISRGKKRNKHIIRIVSSVWPAMGSTCVGQENFTKLQKFNTPLIIVNYAKHVKVKYLLLLLKIP